MQTASSGEQYLILDEATAAQWQEFCKLWPQIQPLLQAGLFSIPSGQFVIDVNNSVIMEITLKKQAYKRKKFDNQDVIGVFLN